MSSPLKHSGFMSVVAGPASSIDPTAPNGTNKPKPKGIDKGILRLPPQVDVPTRKSPAPAPLLATPSLPLPTLTALPVWKLNARSSLTPCYPKLEDSMVSIEVRHQIVPDTPQRKKTVRFALDQLQMPEAPRTPMAPPTPKTRSKKRLISSEDHPGLSELEIGALRAARIMAMPSPPKFGAPEYDSDSSEEEEDEINFMSRRPTMMKPPRASVPPAERSSGNIFASNQPPSGLQLWPVGSYKAAMAAERAKKAEEKAQRDEEQKRREEVNAMREAEEEEMVLQMLDAAHETPEAPTEAFAEAPTEAPEDDLEGTPEHTPKRSIDEQKDEPFSPLSEYSCPSSLSEYSCSSASPSLQSHQRVGASSESQLDPAQHFHVTEENVADGVRGHSEEETNDTKDEEEWVIVDTPERQSPSTEVSNQPRKSPIIPQVMQRVTRSMSRDIRAKIHSMSSGSKDKATTAGSKASTASRGAAKARQVFTKVKSETEMTRTRTKAVSAAESRARTMPTIPESPSVAEPQPTVSRSKRSQLKRRWVADDVQEVSSKKRKLSGQASAAKKAKLSLATKVTAAVPQGPVTTMSQEVVSSSRVSGKRRRDADEEESSSIGARLVKRLRALSRFGSDRYQGEVGFFKIVSFGGSTFGREGPVVGRRGGGDTASACPGECSSMYLTLSFPVSISTTTTTTTIRTHDDDDSHARTTTIRTHTRLLHTHARTHDDTHARIHDRYARRSARTTIRTHNDPHSRTTTTTHQDGQPDLSRLSERRAVSGPHCTLFPAPDEARTDAPQAK
ncbi:hypothetical protein HETIRDRAFT_454918 [Heterobasidion irregulare TC 32-1]|uniref:Uncharacterized protein n=1 Tax=Heterobasidion irregulare (strain TC 32-1) TaxID=747525 RepID=W4JTX3_HETIT|nr:uncharacterized protein HETIRDRAFT_454918 [Heterobasidion irregulare TC 32-1]ETW76311.1 hypothetical protein HETIRDRAFT_454918 [Heterobasidion irregulare TC 32-1]